MALRSCRAALVLAVSAAPLLAVEASADSDRDAPWQAADSEATSARLDEARALAAEGRCEEALPQLEDRVEAESSDAAAWNLLAYCQRQTGRLGEAFEGYERALTLRPRFPQAREYLGEAHLQAALEQLEILQGYGSEGEAAYRKLADALRRAAEGLEAERPPPPGLLPQGDDW